MALLTRRAFAAFAACACLPAPAALAQTTTPGQPGKFVCPPCGCSNDGKVFDKPGVCSDPNCAMELIPAPPEPAKPSLP